MPFPGKTSRGFVSRRTLLARSSALAVIGSLAPASFTRVQAQDATPVGITSAAVTVETGPVNGLETDGVIAYKGIPFAAPPFDEFRWAAPQPVTPWTEPLAADAFCSPCMQVIGDDTPATPSEDCLGLNVWKPANIIIDALLPVMVWIHGGGYVGGSASMPICDGAGFARQGIVVVSFNYRLGRFGYFAPSALLDNTDPPYGNYGYLDQIAALRWVHDNISAFGGDPSRVTLVGESAGGASIIHHMVSPAVEEGLFHQAVILSGAGREALLDRPMTESGSELSLSAPQVDNLFAASLGVIGHGQDELDKLRALSAGKLVGKLDLETLAMTRLLGGTLAGVPAVDGEIVAGQPQDHFLDGTAKLMPVIIGTTAIDVPTHFPPDKLRPLNWFGPDEDAAKDAYGFGDDRFLGPSDLIQLNLAIGVDLTMHEPAHFIASTMADTGHSSWVYRFTYTAESTRPEHEAQIHSGEVPFLFDTLTARYGDAVTENDYATATAFHTYVANFVLRGDPNGEGLPEWPPVAPSEFDVMNFTLDDGPVYGPDPRPTVALVAAARKRHEGENLP